MALEGSLDSFGLTDVLALLAMTNKSGQLVLRRDDTSGGVCLRDGVIVAASSDDARQALARRMIIGGVVPEAALDSVTPGPGLARTLAEAAGLEADRVAPLAREQVMDAVFELLRWESGAFAFGGECPSPAVTDTSLSVEEVVAEAQRRLTDWASVTARVPDPSTVLATTTHLAADVVVSPAEWGVLSLFDGRRSITQAVALSALGEWAAVALLAGLFERGLLIEADTSASSSRRVELLRRLGLHDEVVTAAAIPADAPAVASTKAEPPAEVEPTPAIPVSDAGEPDAEPAVDADTLKELSELSASFAELEAGASADSDDWDESGQLEPVHAGGAEAGDGVDEALLQRLIAGVRAL